MRTYLLAIIVLTLLVGGISCIGETKVFTLPNSSMEPTIMQGEKFAASVQQFQPSRGDLVIFEHQGILVVKRVIGVSGDVVEGRNLQVFVNGKSLDEPYAQHIGKRPLGGNLEAFGPITIPAGQLFVMGDNRDVSFDSRDSRFGLIPGANIKGKPAEIVQSPNSQRVGKALR